MEEIEGESTAERRKRIKALKAGGEKFASLSKKDAQEQGAKKSDSQSGDVGRGPPPQWEEIKNCREGNLSDLHCIKLGEEKEVDPSRKCPVTCLIWCLDCAVRVCPWGHACCEESDTMEHSCVCMCVCMYMYISTVMCVYEGTVMYVYIYTHTHIHKSTVLCV